MNRFIPIAAALISLTLLASAHAADAPRPFLHPGMLQSRSDLEFMKSKVLAGEQPWKAAYDRMCKGSYSSLDFKPQPHEHVIRGAYGRPSIGSNELIASANAAESHALQWYVTGDKAHAAKVIEILSAWSPVLKDFQLNDAKLLAGWTGHQLLNAAEIIRYTDAGWQQRDIDQFKKMILGVYYPLIKDFYPEANGNWDAAIMDTMLCIGVFCDDHAIFDRAVDHYLRGHLNGGITHYVYPSGQCQESTRDQAHTQLGLGEMAQASRVAWTQGVDLFGAADNRLALGFEYCAKYNLGEDVPCENQISTVTRGKFSDIYCVVYDHYCFQKHLAMPYTKRAMEQTAARSHSVLTMYKGPADRPRDTTTPLVTPPYALEGGALNHPTANPPGSAIVVEPGHPIQPAIDSLSGKSGWVVLGKGVHKLDMALRLPSNLTLSGQGADTILWLDPQLSGPAVVNADNAPHDLTLRDLVIEAATTTKLPSDPNSGRRTRSRPGAPMRSGLILEARGSQPASEIRIDHVTVRNCTQTGAEIRSAQRVTIDSSSFTDNGNEPAEQEANLRLVQVTGCQISHTRLNNSPSGCGLAILQSREITLTSNEIARNLREGVRIIDSPDVQIRQNLIEGNESNAVASSTLREPNLQLDLLDNLIQDNSRPAIASSPDSRIVARNNRERDNGK